MSPAFIKGTIITFLRAFQKFSSHIFAQNIAYSKKTHSVLFFENTHYGGDVFGFV